MLLYKVTSLNSDHPNAFINSASSGASMVADSFGSSGSAVAGNIASNGVSSGYFKDKGDNGGYMKDKLSGKR